MIAIPDRISAWHHGSREHVTHAATSGTGSGVMRQQVPVVSNDIVESNAKRIFSVSSDIAHSPPFGLSRPIKC